MELKLNWKVISVIGVLILIGLATWKYESAAVALVNQAANIFKSFDTIF